MKDYPYVPGWRLNKENNKPAIKHSVLMLTRHGVAEGEYDGSEWVQYRWSCKVNDSDVLYWIHLEDLTQLEKEGGIFQHEQPDNEDIDKVAQELYEHLYELKRRNNVPTNLYDKQEIINLWKAGIEYAYNHPKQEQPEVDLVAELKHHLATTPKEQLEKEWKELEPWGNIGPTVHEFLYGKQPEVDFEKEMNKLISLEYVNQPDDEWEMCIARHFYELGRARKEE